MTWAEIWQLGVNVALTAQLACNIVFGVLIWRLENRVRQAGRILAALLNDLASEKKELAEKIRKVKTAARGIPPAPGN